MSYYITIPHKPLPIVTFPQGHPVYDVLQLDINHVIVTETASSLVIRSAW